MTDCYTSMNHQELINKLKERNNPNELDLANTINTLEKCKFTGYHLLKCLKQGDEYTKKLINYNPEDEEILDQVNIIINRLWIDQSN